ncbi:MAG: GNAT family N-acetyltransferase/peptidase C39 family protein [Gammaproteobacteria bacterium]|nr:GNAT family N-acetyltransferase/peptidase C39 family protein [Gammaproteobacteria bacterium]
MIRAAIRQDINALVALESRAFETDRLSRRSFRRMIDKAHADLLVACENDVLAGYVLVLYHRGTQLARLYSIAVDTDFRGKGIGGRLLEAGEAAAVERGCVFMRLEIRDDNSAAAALYQQAGYEPFDSIAHYYEDDADALRMEKSLGRHLKPAISRVPHYAQTTEFTCGPAALMMAMRALDESIPLDRKLELRLWRESTTIFMTSGHGGCGPYGLALGAAHRGFDVEVFVSEPAALFVDTVRSEEKKEVIRLVHEDMAEEIARRGIPVSFEPATLETLEAAHDAGGIALVLISSWQLYREKFPHWVVITGFDDRFVYTHDPYIDSEEGKTLLDASDMPIRRDTFANMARYGRNAQRAALIIRKAQ